MNIPSRSSYQRISVSSAGTVLLVSGYDLKLYTCIYRPSPIVQCIKTYSENITAVKALHCHPSKEIVALGSSTGRVQLANISLTPDDFSLTTLAEFSPLHSRSCSTTLFSPSGNYILSGLDKVRNDYGLQVYATERGVPFMKC